ncbi:MAG: hypothetical protein OXH65_06295 [Paracoccaceae bacterium]|nr:hypothetical protein [Paracoccaceae bacterium]
MSILKYTAKYLLLGGLGFIVIVGIGTLVYSQIQKHSSEKVYRAPTSLEDHSHDGLGVIELPAKPPPGESEKTGHWDGNVWKKIPVKVKKRTRQTSHTHGDHDHSHFKGPPAPSRIPRDLKKRLEKVKSDGNAFYNNPNYFQEVYEAVSNGRDMETTIDILKEYGIFTDVVLEHMDSYEAFEYALNSSIPADYIAPTTMTGPDMKYAKRVIAEDPSSPQALEAGLYLGRLLREPHEKQTAYLKVLEHHPNSSMALDRLGRLLSYDQPELSVPYLKKASQLDPSHGSDSELGVAYERLGDYKTAWIHYKKALKHNPDDYCIINLIAIENGDPILFPIVREPADVPVPDSLEARHDMPPLPPTKDTDTFLEFPEGDDSPISPAVLESPTREDMARQEAERQASERRALLERMREQQEMEQEAYFEELEEFINWAESIMNDTPIDTNNFLAKELERHLLEQKTTFAADRVTRGFELIQRYGQDEGIKRLETVDPKLAREVKQMLNEKINRSKRSKPTQR